MFKALIVLFITSPFAPMGKWGGEFPDRFTSAEACNHFLAGKQKEIGDTVDMITAEGEEFKAVVVGRKLWCVRDRTGEQGA